MINKTELLDPTALEKRSPYEQSVIEGAHNAGHGPRYINSENHCGSLQQTINPSAIKAAECGAPGCDSDISDGIASLSEMLGPTENT